MIGNKVIDPNSSVYRIKMISSVFKVVCFEIIKYNKLDEYLL